MRNLIRTYAIRLFLRSQAVSDCRFSVNTSETGFEPQVRKLYDVNKNMLSHVTLREWFSRLKCLVQRDGDASLRSA